MHSWDLFISQEEFLEKSVFIKYISIHCMNTSFLFFDTLQKSLIQFAVHSVLTLVTCCMIEELIWECHVCLWNSYFKTFLLNRTWIHYVGDLHLSFIVLFKEFPWAMFRTLVCLSKTIQFQYCDSFKLCRNLDSLLGRLRIDSFELHGTR